MLEEKGVEAEARVTRTGVTCGTSSGGIAGLGTTKGAASGMQRTTTYAMAAEKKGTRGIDTLTRAGCFLLDDGFMALRGRINYVCCKVG